MQKLLEHRLAMAPTLVSMPPLLETLPAPDFKEAVVMLPSPVTLSALEPCLVVLLRSWGTLLAPEKALVLTLQSLGTRLIAWHPRLACMLPLSILPPALLDP